MNTSRLVKLAGPAGLYSLARQFTRNHPRILMYHRFSEAEQSGFVSAAAFEQQVRYIARHHHAITAGALITALRDGTRLPPHTLVVTVDDGYEDFHRVAWPILKRHGVPATLFATTGFVDGELWLWPDQVAWLLDRTPESSDAVTVAEQRITVDGTAWQRLIDVLLTLPDAEKHLAIAAMAEQLGLVLPKAAPTEFASVSWDQLRELEQAGIEVGGHTCTHPTLPKVQTSELPKELDACLARINEELGERPRPFCYPNGQPSDYSQTVRDAVEQAGFIGAVVAHADHASHADVYQLRRHSSSANPFQFMKAASGIEWLGRRIKNRGAAA
ncbi:peptidoglycan/xylan/chitin deacetylase (PgdA/CDA1 family) [Natronocella acetinitrilica]|uniref:Peptidoglycan/xylan/chitin deacetylase (PgdA/CDA1 family) n=1 Tax=Natronocella acetinitrilica TaxID=414046 RepID=A0AAE3KI92_9GAMM|nr:polysaccharide deacetylase family protein [Natronocella acetinitrilica]MCP1677152.1 peptidoglycan/xylan/chitin deacetylase (PgdA/CDA1 family) [Natronocella acetinitrilica]